jgi:hypothetical protein
MIETTIGHQAFDNSLPQGGESISILISEGVHTTPHNFNDSNISLHFHNDFGIFCEGQRRQGIVERQHISLLLPSTQMDGLVGHYGGSNGGVGHAGINSLFGFIDHNSLIGFSLNGLISPNDIVDSGINSLIDQISLVCLCLIGLCLVNIIGLVSLVGLIGHISLSNLGIISLISSSALSACQLIGLVSFVGLSTH